MSEWVDGWVGCVTRYQTSDKFAFCVITCLYLAVTMDSWTIDTHATQTLHLTFRRQSNSNLTIQGCYIPECGKLYVLEV